MTASVETAPHIRDAIAAAHEQLRRTGTWFDAEQLGAIAGRARAVFGDRCLPPWQRELPTEVPGLVPAAVAVIDKIATDPGSVDRAWARARVAELGDGAYVELVGITAVAVIIDSYAYAAGEGPEPFAAPHADPGRPNCERPDGLGDIGAHVPMLDPFPMANVARALSLVPSANAAFYTLVRPMYSSAGFEDLVWHTALSRPQVELVASRVAAMNECFY